MDKTDTKKLKVLFLPRWYPNRTDPMPGLFIERHARAVAANCQVSVLYVHPDPGLQAGQVDEVWQADEELLQLRIYYGPMSGNPGLLSQLANLCRYVRLNYHGYRAIRKRAGKPDLIHVNVLTRLGFLALLLKWATGTPYVVTEHWTRYLPHMDNYRGWLRKLITRLVVKNAAAMLPVTDNLRVAMEKRGLKNANWIVIPNVVDTRMFSPAVRKDTGTLKSILHVSCFEDKQKNISGILRMLRILANERQDWVCHMVGDGIHYDRLVSMARELGLEGGQVLFHGLKENGELAEMMQSADFQLLFSRFENLPVVILESLACGVPVLSTDVGGIREHLHPEMGILIAAEDEQSLLEKVTYMLDHAGGFDKAYIRNYAQQHFSKEVIGRQIFDVYRSVTNNSRIIQQ